MANNIHKNQNQNQNELTVNRNEVELIKPAKPTTIETLSLSSLDNDPNLEILCQSVYVFKAKTKSSDENGHETLKMRPSFVIKEALAKALVHYYPLAGKLKRHSGDGKLYINCSGEGVPFMEAKTNCKLSSLNYFDDVDVDTCKEFTFDCSESKDDQGYHPLAIQVTEFCCGGFTIGMALSHSVCDGFGASQFVRALAELASGMSEPSVKPVWERERLVAKQTKEPLNVDRSFSALRSTIKDTGHECFNISSDTLSRLKANMLKELRDNHVQFTTVEVLASFIWRSRYRAFESNRNGTALFFLTMGIRHILDPPLPTGYYGNAFVSCISALPGKDLNELPLSEIALLVKESKKKTASKDEIWRRINNMEKFREMNVKMGAGGASMVLTDWRQLGLLEDLDFGLDASLVTMRPVPWDKYGSVDLCFLLPPSKLDPSMKGGVRLFISLPRLDMPKFKEEMDAHLQLE